MSANVEITDTFDQWAREKVEQFYLKNMIQ